MANLLDDLTLRHETLLDLLEEAADRVSVTEVQEFMQQLAQAGADISGPRERSQLRGIIRFWSSFVYDRIGQFPDVQLLPAIASASSLDAQGAQPGKLKRLDGSSSQQPSGSVSAQVVGNEMVADSRIESQPSMIGPYEIVEEIGRGGFSKAYKALDTTSGRVVALKVIPKEQFGASSRLQERLLERERMALELSHPRIVPVYAVDEFAGAICIAMKLVQSGSLSDRLSHWYWRPSLKQILDLVAQAAEGLVYLHRRGIVHGDLKPSNMLVSLEDRVYLSDYSNAQEIQSVYRGVLVGTPEYMAPEMIIHPDSVDARADLYSLGIILFQLLLGYLPFRARSVDETFHLQVREPLPPLRGLPFEIALLIRKCLEKDPSDRFNDASQLLGDLQKLQATLPDETLGRIPPHFTSRPEARLQPSDTAALDPLSLFSLAEHCPACQSPTALGIEFCGNCGWDLRQPAPQRPSVGSERALTRCPKCKNPCSPSAAFCGACGVLLTGGGVSRQVPTAAAPPVPVQPAAVSSRDYAPQDTVIIVAKEASFSPKIVAILLVDNASVVPQHFVVNSEKMTIGRSAHNEVVIDHPTVSQQHALLVYQKPNKAPGSFALYDLASSNGTVINDEIVDAYRELQHNDVITLGQVKLVFKRLDDEPQPIVVEPRPKRTRKPRL